MLNLWSFLHIGHQTSYREIRSEKDECFPTCSMVVTSDVAFGFAVRGEEAAALQKDLFMLLKWAA